MLLMYIIRNNILLPRNEGWDLEYAEEDEEQSQQDVQAPKDHLGHGSAL